MATDIHLELPDHLYEAIEHQANREYRTVDCQILWMLEQQISRTPTRPRGNPAAAREFATALHELHVSAGHPSTRTIAAAVGEISHTTVAYSLNGSTIPTWGTAERIVTYLQGDMDTFRELWQAIWT